MTPQTTQTTQNAGYKIVAPQASRTATNFTRECNSRREPTILVYNAQKTARVTYMTPIDRELNDKGLIESAQIVLDHLQRHGIRHKNVLHWSIWGRELGDFSIHPDYAEDLAKELVPVLNDPDNFSIAPPFILANPPEFNEILEKTFHAQDAQKAQKEAIE
jgi:hypothetical protein